jgi:chorismate dehydratase
MTATALAMKIARLPYLNVLPFFLDDGLKASVSVSPRRLGQEAAEGRVDAGPLSLVDAWRLEDEFEPLGPFGIAVRGPARSVLLFSHHPMEELDQVRIGVTDQTSTSVKLLEVLLRFREGVQPVLAPGFSADDTARLVIGDQALSEGEALRERFRYVFDLGREWYLWRERPFVFAKWMVRKSMPAFAKEELKDRLEASLARFERNRDAAVWKAGEKAVLPPARLKNYLTGFVYRLGEGEREAEELFRGLAARLANGGCEC